MLGWAIIGTGDISVQFASDLQAATAGAVRGVWGRTQVKSQAFADSHGIPFATSSLAGLLAREDIDVVYIATPAATHLPIALRSLDAGKHVLIEKPMTMSENEALKLFERARERKKFAMEAMWMRFNPLHVDVLERIQDGLIGEPRSVRAGFGTPFFPRGNRRTAADRGSVLRDRGIYLVTLAQWFLGEPMAVQAAGVFQADTDVAGHATLEFEGGGFAHLAWSGVEFLEQSASVSGGSGWVTLEPMFWAGSRARLHAGDYQRIFRAPDIVEHPRLGNGFRPMISAVGKAIEDGLLEHPWQRHDDTLAVARTMDRILAATGGSVERP